MGDPSGGVSGSEGLIVIGSSRNLVILSMKNVSESSVGFLSNLVRKFLDSALTRDDAF